MLSKWKRQACRNFKSLDCFDLTQKYLREYFKICQAQNAVRKKKYVMRFIILIAIVYYYHCLSIQRKLYSWQDTFSSSADTSSTDLYREPESSYT